MGTRLTRAKGVGRMCVTHCLSEYIVCLSGLRFCHHSLTGLTVTSHVSSLFGTVGSRRFVQSRQGSFCGRFSGSFLRLFPRFVASFGRLLMRRKEVCPGSNRLLAARLHVFTLVHLKIASDGQVTRFLKCSLTAVCGCHDGVHGGTVKGGRAFRRRIVGL